MFRRIVLPSLILTLVGVPWSVGLATDGAGLFDLAQPVERLASGFSAASLFADDVATDPTSADPGAIETSGDADRGKAVIRGFQGTELSIGAGLLFGPEVKVEEGGDSFNLDLEDDFLLKLCLDFWPSEFIGGGVYLQYAESSIEKFAGITVPGGFTNDIWMFEGGVAIKGRLPLFDFLYITPGLSFGYRAIFIDFADTIEGDRIDGLAINFGVDIRVRLGVLEIWIEPGFLTQPWGQHQDGDADVTFDPVPYLAGGLALAF